ncbi:DUF1631 family protein [Ramlibacter sp. PS3R-8]|uniref:DUF1631 family protein n=1 Tax=Ramlibacter sp. PS3R-8 TaxID=3133437 RepID=UPI0030A2F6BD
MSAVSPTVARSIGAACAVAGALVDQCVDHAVAELQAAEARAMSPQRQQLSDAWRELLARRKGWKEQFPRLLASACERDARDDGSGAHAGFTSSFADLSLVDDNVIASKIESSRLAQQLTSALERPLSELDALMSSALGLEVIHPERNPLRPAVYARVLRRMMGEGVTDTAWTGLWLRSMAKPLAEQLDLLYVDQVKMLSQAQVHAAHYRLVTTASPSAPSRTAGMPSVDDTGHAGATGEAPSAPQALASSSGFADLAPQQAIDGARLQRFLLRGETQTHRPLAPSFHAQARAELLELESDRGEQQAYDAGAARQHMHLPAVDRPPRRVATDSPLPQDVWGGMAAPRERALVRGRLKTEAREAGQVFGLEVVRRLVDRVAEDPRLLAPVREAIVGLEPSLARLAMVAPRFFSDEAHPGRLLVEKVAERSFKFNDEFSVEFQGFFNAVAQSFSRLNQVDPVESPEPFRLALDTLQAGWSAQDAMDDEAQHKVLEAVQLVEKRQHEAERIASELWQRADLADAPQPVQEFLLGPWALVVAHARLAQPQGGIDPGGHLGVVTELLWSVNSELILREPARAFEVIPRVLQKVRAGLESLGQRPGEANSFFQHLEQLHRPVMKLRARHRHRDVAPVEPVRLPGDASDIVEQGDQLWMAPSELRAAGFEDTVPSEVAQLRPARALHAPLPVLDQGEADHVVAALALGAWVDLFSRQQWRRAKLVWASAKGSLFMFVSHGGQPHSMTRRSLQRLVKKRLLRPVERDGVVPRALEKLGEPSAPMPLAA